MEAETAGTPQGADEGVYGVRDNDPAAQLLDLSQIDESDVEQISRLMQALGTLREAERKVSEASARYMKLNEIDMRALHYLIVNENRGRTVTPGDIAGHLGISAAATTKLLDRLERGGHVTRSPHPTDRRALQIRITAQTRQAAYETVGRHQARRFHSAARLSQSEREVVIRFLRDMASEIDIKHIDWVADE